MRNYLGPVLIQLPPVLKYNPIIAEPFFKLLHMQYAKYSFELEIINPTWLEKLSKNLMAKYDVSCVISQSDNHYPYAETIEGKHIYIRFQGPGLLYASSYSDDALKAYADKMMDWRNKGHTIWAFFNNDVKGCALKDAEKLLTLTQ